MAEQQRLPQGKARRLARVDGETARCRDGFGGQARLLGEIQLGSSVSSGMDGGKTAGDVNGDSVRQRTPLAEQSLLREQLKVGDGPDGADPPVGARERQGTRGAVGC